MSTSLLQTSAAAVVDDGWRIPDPLWERIEPLLPKRHRHRKGGRPPLPWRGVLDGIFFVLRTGCQWKALPKAFGSASSVHRYFQSLVRRRVFGKLWRLALEEYDQRQGIDWEWQAIDGCMTKAPLGGKKTGKNPTDRAKKGTKRSLLTDGRGVPLGLTVSGANRPDNELVTATLESIPIERPKPTLEQPQHFCGDKIYDCKDGRQTVLEYGYTAHIPHKRRKNQKEPEPERQPIPGYRARRWVVERTHSWMNRFRRLLIRWEKKVGNYVALLHFACAWIAYRAAGVLG
jgi:putative transposase